VKLAVSNIGLTAFDHTDELSRLSALGLSGLEVAPSRIWHDTGDGLTAPLVESYRRAVEDSGLAVVGLHSLLFDRPDLGLFTDTDTRRRTIDFLVHLSAVCRDLGGRTLIWGGKRWRGSLGADDAVALAVDALTAITARTADHGTVFCFEPLGPADSDFINKASESQAIVRAVGREGVGVQLDAKALFANGEATAETVAAVAEDLVHVHANEPDLGVLGSSGEIDHAHFGAMLRDAGYDGFVSIEQRMINAGNPIGDIATSAAVLRECYG